MSKYILVIDSGVGGLAILFPLMKKLPNVNFVYLFDNKYSPLGSRSTKFLRRHLLKMIEEVRSKYDLSMIVLACNTLTVSCVSFLREHLDIEIVGTEPNIHVSDDNGRVLVLATPYTAKNCELIRNRGFVIVGLPNMSRVIDERFFDTEFIDAVVYKNLSKYKGYKQVIIGCTHYIWIMESIKKVLGDDVKFFVNTDGVVNRVVSIHNKNGFEDNKLCDSVVFLFGEKNERFVSIINHYFPTV